VFAAQWQAAKLAITRAKTPEEREEKKAHFAELNAQFVAFDYARDLEGGGCPLGAHTRRANPRSALEFGQLLAFETPGGLSNRRRLIRRGLPYGDSSKARDDKSEHGIIFMAINASLRRQFEFVQQQWMNYGNDFRLANDKDPLVGNHGRDERGHGTGQMVIQTAQDDPRPPFFCSKLPRFVETRGGEYFFIPSLTALRMIAEGSIDPT
jgi:deferrochelatase/peroxidase EfeB